MSWIDWSVLVFTLSFITIYGLWKSRADEAGADDFLRGKRDLKWWTIGLSIMATQASAITFLSTPGQAFTDGLRFIQFYLGMPVAMVILAVFVLPIFYRLNVLTAYEFLENRFDGRVRTLTALLFLTQRGIAAAISIYAPSIILSAILGWPLGLTNCFMAIFVMFYTMTGGASAVSKTQELQMTIMIGGIVTAFFVILFKLPADVSFSGAMDVAGALGKTEAVSFDFDLQNPARSLQDRYNFWSGILGGTFLFLSYFGTDQSQVGRYLSGKSLTESRLGLLFNGIVKVPMQFLVLLVGVMVFVFYQFNPSPLHFHEKNRAALTGENDLEMRRLEARHDSIFLLKKPLVEQISRGQKGQTSGDGKAWIDAKKNLQLLDNEDVTLKKRATNLIQKAVPDAPKDTDYVFISFVQKHLPIGLIGLMFAVIFCASWSTTASELSALSTTSVVDIYKRRFVKNATDAHYKKASRVATLCWGVFIMLFATFASLPENLIQMVNRVGSMFYGTILGIFAVAFFIKSIGGRAVLIAASATMFLIGWLWKTDAVAFLWWNPIGCFSVIGIGFLIEKIWPELPRKSA